VNSIGYSILYIKSQYDMYTEYVDESKGLWSSCIKLCCCSLIDSIAHHYFNCVKCLTLYPRLIKRGIVYVMTSFGEMMTLTTQVD